ncbi:MAG: DUF4280 domain-containing protein [Bacteroidales bacterium]|nr:DUF4280 domain-containing protein [Bacteroidales bacterium]
MPTFVASTATMECTMGDSQSSLNVLPSRTIFLCGKPKANISDHAPIVNISPFGKCRSLANPVVAAATAANMGKLTPMPCIPNTPSPWKNGHNTVMEKGDASLLDNCKLQCVWNGLIGIKKNGQQ